MPSPIGYEQLDHADALRERMRRLMQDSSSADVIFIVGPEVMRVGAHRAVVKCASEPLGAMLYSSMREGTQAEVELPMVDPESFRKFLQYVYTGELEIDVVSAVHLHQLADMYAVTALRDACCQLLNKQGSIQVSKVCDVLSAALHCANIDVAEVCMCIITSSGTDVLKRPELMRLPVDAFEHILQRDDLEAEEAEVFNAFLRWSEATDRNGEKKQADDVQRLKRLIRLPFVPMSDLLGAADDSGLFSRDELFAAAKYQMHPGEVVKGNADRQFVRRAPAPHILLRWELRPPACGKAELNNDAACLKKIGTNFWDVLAIARLPSTETIGSHAPLQCKVRVDHINGSDRSGLVIGAVGDFTHKYGDCVGICGEGRGYNVETQSGTIQQLCTNDVVAVRVNIRTRSVEIRVDRDEREVFCLNGTCPAAWGAQVYIGAHVYYMGDILTIIK